MSDEQNGEEPQHGMAQACYTLVPPGEYEPHMECLCGSKFTAPSWAEVGAEMDEHLEEVTSA